jgi:hypothetical protein
MGVLLPAFLTSALVGGEWLASPSGRLGKEHSAPTGRESGFNCDVKIVLMVLVLEYVHIARRSYCFVEISRNTVAVPEGWLDWSDFS